MNASIVILYAPSWASFIGTLVVLILTTIQLYLLRKTRIRLKILNELLIGITLNSKQNDDYNNREQA